MLPIFFKVCIYILYWDVYWYTLGNGLLFWNRIKLMSFPLFLLQREGKVVVTFMFHSIQLRSASLYVDK